MWVPDFKLIPEVPEDGFVSRGGMQDLWLLLQMSLQTDLGEVFVD